MVFRSPLLSLKVEAFMKSPNNESGFSLLEVTVALAVMTTIMGVAFMLLNNFQLAYQREEAYADAARNARFAVSRLEEIVRSAGTTPTRKTALKSVRFSEFSRGTL